MKALALEVGWKEIDQEWREDHSAKKPDDSEAERKVDEAQKWLESYMTRGKLCRQEALFRRGKLQERMAAPRQASRRA